MRKKNTASDISETSTNGAATLIGRPYAGLVLTALIGLFVLPAVIAAPIQVNSIQQSPASGGECTLAAAITAANTDSTVDGCVAGSGADFIFVPADNYVLSSPDNGDGGVGDNGLPAITTDITMLAARGTTSGPVIERAAAADPFRILYISSTGVLRLVGLAVRGGRVSGPGAGIFVDGGTLVIDDGAVSDNEALGGDGGSIRNNGGSVTMTKCSLTGNTAVNGGGVSSNGTMVINECDLSRNAASGDGGALYNAAGTVRIDKKTLLSLNTAVEDGGAIFNDGGIVSILNRTTLSKNSADANGGGIHNSGIVSINGSTLIKNAAGLNGGGVYNSAGRVTVSVATLSWNEAGATAVGDGGAIFNASGDTNVRINDSAIFNNTADNGGAIYTASDLALLNTTLSRNTATVSGGAIYGTSSGSTTINSTTISENAAEMGGGIFGEPSGGALGLENTILSRNTASDGSDCSGDVKSQDHNLVGVGGPPCDIVLATHDISGDAKLSKFIVDRKPGRGYFQLKVISRAIDKADNGTCPQVDQIGQERINNRCDIGAIEFPEAIPDSGHVDHALAAFNAFYDSRFVNSDSFQIVALLSKNPFDDFNFPFDKDVTINVDLTVGTDLHEIYRLTIPANTVAGTWRGKPLGRYLYTVPPTVRKVLIDRITDTSIRLTVHLTRIELLESLRNNLAPQEYLDTVLKQVKGYKITVDFGGVLWSGTAPLKKNANNRSTTRMIFTLQK